MAKKIRFGLVGCGVIHSWHAEVLANLKEEAELVAVCDVIEERARKSAEKYGVAAYTDYAEMLKRDDLDAIAIGTPSGLHADMGLAAVRSGRHVVVEKPIDINLRKADELVRAAREAGVTLTSIAQNRFGKGTRKLREWLDEGKLGRIVYGESTVKWYRSQEYYDSGDWRGTWELDGGGALMNQGVHYADLLRWAMGKPKTVFARAATMGHNIAAEDVVTATLEFESGAIGTLTATTCAYPGYSTTLEVYGTEGSVRTANNELVSAEFINGEKYTADSLIVDTGSSDPRAISHDGHTQQFRDFIAAIHEGRDPYITGEMGRDALELVLGVYLSAFSGKVVDFPLPPNTGGGK